LQTHGRQVADLSAQLTATIIDISQLIINVIVIVIVVIVIIVTVIY